MYADVGLQRRLFGTPVDSRVHNRVRADSTRDGVPRDQPQHCMRTPTARRAEVHLQSVASRAEYRFDGASIAARATTRVLQLNSNTR